MDGSRGTVLPADRRSFLKMAGFAVSATALNGCVRGLEREVVPYLVAPEEGLRRTVELR